MIIPNTGPPTFKKKLSNIIIQVNEMLMLQLPGLADPDIEDTPSFVSADFGLSSSFVQGKFPSYKIQPASNATDPGVYEVKVVLMDDNPNKQQSSFSFKITVTPLPPLVVVQTKVIKEV